MSYEVVIGLEVHVHLKTESKLFCSCSTRFGQEPNGNVCEICSAMPGALPAPNREAIRLAAIAGLATNCSINRRSLFARKNYFYPDLPAGYQISQFDLPICENGFLEIEAGGKSKKIGITRIHIENDAGKNIHESGKNASFVDLNRAGIPMVEIVSEPDLRSPQEAYSYLKNLHSLVTYLEISDGNMEEGSFRCDANISLRPTGCSNLGTRTELKNINSFRNVQRALEYEIMRQEEVLMSGNRVVQETRLYDAEKNCTLAMRNKEEAQDYRYFPDPDLQPVLISEMELEELRNAMPELPAERIRKFEALTGLPHAEAELLASNRRLADFFENAAMKADGRKIAAIILGPLMRECKSKNIPVDPACWKFDSDALAELIHIIENGVISSKIANEIFPELFVSGKMPKSFVEEKGLAQISDSTALEEIVDRILAANPAEADALRNGKTKLTSFFIGQIMRETKGKANPGLANTLLKNKLGKGD